MGTVYMNEIGYIQDKTGKIIAGSSDCIPSLTSGNNEGLLIQKADGGSYIHKSGVVSVGDEIILMQGSNGEYIAIKSGGVCLARSIYIESEKMPLDFNVRFHKESNTLHLLGFNKDMIGIVNCIYSGDGKTCLRYDRNFKNPLIDIIPLINSSNLTNLSEVPGIDNILWIIPEYYGETNYSRYVSKFLTFEVNEYDPKSSKPPQYSFAYFYRIYGIDKTYYESGGRTITEYAFLYTHTSSGQGYSDKFTFFNMDYWTKFTNIISINTQNGFEIYFVYLLSGSKTPNIYMNGSIYPDSSIPLAIKIQETIHDGEVKREFYVLHNTQGNISLDVWDKDKFKKVIDNLQSALPDSYRTVSNKCGGFAFDAVNPLIVHLVLADRYLKISLTDHEVTDDGVVQSRILDSHAEKEIGQFKLDLNYKDEWVVDKPVEIYGNGDEVYILGVGYRYYPNSGQDNTGFLFKRISSGIWDDYWINFYTNNEGNYHTIIKEESNPFFIAYGGYGGFLLFASNSSYYYNYYAIDTDTPFKENCY